MATTGKGWRVQTIEEVVGGNIKAARTVKGMSQADLGAAIAAYLGDTWKRRQAVWTAETGKRAFTAAELLTIAHILGTSVGDLFKPPFTVAEVEVAEGAPAIDVVGKARLQKDAESEIEARLVNALTDLGRAQIDQATLAQGLFDTIEPAMNAYQEATAALDDFMVLTRFGKMPEGQDGTEES